MEPNRRRSLENLVFGAHRNAIHCLSFLHGGAATTNEIAAHIGVSAKTVRVALTDLNRQFVSLVNKEPVHTRGSSAHGLVHISGHKWTLTRAGRGVARAANLANERLLEALDAAVSSQVEAWLTVTNNCWNEFDALAHAVRDRVALRPRTARSSDINLHISQTQHPEVLAANFALYSVCIEGGVIRKGQHLPALPGAWDKNTEVIVTATEPFQILSRHSTFGNVDAVEASKLLSNKLQVVVPVGGAVQDYLHLLDPAWRRVVREVRATDLEACLGVLQYGGLTDSVMLVHGVDPNKVPPRFALYDIAAGPDAQAVRGLFHRKGFHDPSWSEREREKWNDVWATAQRLWHTDLTPALKEQ